MPRTNRVKQAIADGRIATGFSLCFPSPHIVEILGRLDFDFVWLDGEHGPFDLATLEVFRPPIPICDLRACIRQRSSLGFFFY